MSDDRDDSKEIEKLVAQIRKQEAWEDEPTTLTGVPSRASKEVQIAVGTMLTIPVKQRGPLIALIVILVSALVGFALYKGVLGYEKVKEKAGEEQGNSGPKARKEGSQEDRQKARKEDGEESRQEDREEGSQEDGS